MLVGVLDRRASVMMTIKLKTILIRRFKSEVQQCSIDGMAE